MAIILHRFDLRVHDNPAVNKAEKPQPIYIFDPDLWDAQHFSSQRKRFVFESLHDLKDQYEKRGGQLRFFHGDTRDVLRRVSDDHRVVFNKDANHFQTSLETHLRSTYRGVDAGAIQYGGRDRSTWSKQLSTWLDEEPERTKSSFETVVDGNTTLKAMKDKYGEPVQKDRFGRGGRRAGLERLNAFRHRISHYAANISSPAKAEQMTSHLSPYIRYGCLSVREVHQAFQDDKEDNAAQFKDRLVWHQHFQQKREDNPCLHEQAINPVYQDLHRDKRDNALIRAWKQGRTGYPLVDATMRALKQTGWMNFRMRAMAASFYSYILKQWWKTGADHFYKHLVDADLAINHYQWQMQSGLVGVHANRIYDPTKQVRDNDPNGAYIKRYVPELCDVPADKIAQPWQLTEGEQTKYDVVIGDDYPEPVVDYGTEARQARAYFKRKAPEAYEAFKDDEVWRRASLSDRHSREHIVEKAGGMQPALTEFTEDS